MSVFIPQFIWEPARSGDVFTLVVSALLLLGWAVLFWKDVESD